jgi:hypothetical protein
MPKIADDPVVALVAERFRLEAACGKGFTDDDAENNALVERTGDQIAILDREIAGIVATSPAGIKAQIQVFHELCEGVFHADERHKDDCMERMKATIAAGIKRLPGTEGPASR